MNRDFEGLLAQIAGLEASHRKDEAKLLQEQLQHQNTKKELEQALAALEKYKIFVVDLKKEVGQMKASLSAERKTNDQLKQTVRNAKHENQLLREHTIKVVEKMKAQREEFLHNINNTNQSLRELRARYSEQELAYRVKILEDQNKELQQEALQYSCAPSSGIRATISLEEQLAQVMEQKQALATVIEELQRKLVTEQKDKQARVEEMEAAVELIAQLKEQADHTKLPIELRSEESNTTTNVLDLQEQLAQARSIIAQQKQQLMERHVSLEEFKELDTYTSTLAANYADLQAYCSALEQRIAAAQATG